MLAHALDVGQQLDIFEARGEQRLLPILRRQKAAIRPEFRMQHGAAKGLEQQENELRIDRLPGERSNALAEHQPAAGPERARDR